MSFCNLLLCFIFSHQPETLTIIVETSNYIFSAVFAVEMLLKIMAEGPFGYISNGYNVFDGIIVILRYVPTVCLNHCMVYTSLGKFASYAPLKLVLTS